MLKMKSIVHTSINNRDYEFYCSPDSPLQDALEAIVQVQAFLIGRQEQNKPQEQPTQEAVKSE